MAKKIGAIQAAQDVLDHGYYGVPQRRRIDATSANCIIQVAAKLSADNRAKLDAMPVRKAALVCWRLVGS